MRKLILFCALIFTIKVSAQKILTIDSLNRDTTYAGQLVKVYMTASGPWTSSYPLTLRLNTTVVISATYQDLVDSAFVWSFIVPATTPIGNNVPITIYSAVTHIVVTYPPITTGINEYNSPDKYDAVFYYNVSGQEINKPDSGLYIEAYYFNGNRIRTRKVLK